MNQKDLDQLSINAIRALTMDAVQKANSGHPGMPMGAADMAYILWTRFLKQNPANPNWADRDRFVLSAGHGSMLIYSLLHLSGYEVSMDELKNFRMWGSITPGHPEHGLTPGVETTTGPLGQGLANSVGMAIAEQYLATRYNRPGHTIVDHYSYGICGDGDLMEGVSRRSGLAGRAPQAGQADLPVRQQPHHHRRVHRPGLHRRRRQALRGLRLARPARRRLRPRGHRRRH